MGDGRYTLANEYKDWFLFSKSMRIHQNLLENIGPLIVCQLIVGLMYPLVPIIGGSIYIFLRLGYGFNYARKISTRAYFFPFIMLYQIGMPIFAIVTAFQMFAKGSSAGSYQKVIDLSTGKIAGSV